jgi:ubiquinone/menaquinone biosynthesis C-methylase UbiE
MVISVMDSAEYRRMATVEQTHWWYKATRKLLHQFIVNEVQELGRSTPRRFLDAGCGTGATGAWLADLGSVIALDSEPEALNLYRNAHPEAQLILGDISAIDLPNDFVDAALCVTVLYHGEVADPAASVREMARVVRSGGLVCLMEPGVRSLRRSHDRVTHAARRFSRRDLEKLAQLANLDIVRSTGAYSFLIPPAWLKSKLEKSDSTSDLDNNASGLFGILGFIARIERQLLRVVSLPFGLSVIVIARKKS